MSFDRERIQEQAASLAVQGVYLGTSSWKYEGWMGQLYSAERYEYRGKVAKTRFERDCLREYAEVFKTVCVDAAYYTFPSQQYLERMAEQLPEDFLFGLKVTDTVTIKKYPKLDRFGDMAGKPNENFLNADLFPGMAESVAYLFMTCSGEADGTWLPDGGENGLIVLPRGKLTSSFTVGDAPRLSRMVKKWWRRMLISKVCVFDAKLTRSDDPAFIPEAKLFDLPEADATACREALTGNKLGGTPGFIGDT
jgi:hypothetical protein